MSSAPNLSLPTSKRFKWLSDLWAGTFGGNTKHDYYHDYGWPTCLDFDNFYRAYTRSSLAAAGVNKTIEKTWETLPALWETEKPAESKLEEDIRRHFDKVGIWRALMNVDRRSMVGRYAGAILVLRDGKPMHEPVNRVRGNIEGLAGVIPGWEGQLEVAEWDEVMTSDRYGEPTYYQFNQSAVGDPQGGGRNTIRIHHDRVIIFSEDGTVNARSALEAGYNDIIDAEKVKGAGGEGFWKSSRGTPVIQAPTGVTPQDVMRGMAASSGAELQEKLNEQVDSVARGFDKAYMMGGFGVSTLAITLPQPKEFWEIPAMQFAASLSIPFKVLIGNVTGERASTEDGAEWNQTCMSRRDNRVKPQIHELIGRLVRWGVLPERDWTIGWDDLAEATATDKIERAHKMAEINAKSLNEPVFLPDEIREAGGFAPSQEIEGWDEFMAERMAEMEGRAEDVTVVEGEGARDV